MVISNINVYGLEESVSASKYPMLADVSCATNVITERVKKIGEKR